GSILRPPISSPSVSIAERHPGLARPPKIPVRSELYARIRNQAGHVPWPGPLAHRGADATITWVAGQALAHRCDGRSWRHAMPRAWLDGVSGAGERRRRGHGHAAPGVLADGDHAQRQ